MAGYSSTVEPGPQSASLFRRYHRFLSLLLIAGITSSLVYLLGPLVLWAYSIERAGRLMEQGLSWPEPRQVDSLPQVANHASLDQAQDYLAAAIAWRPDHPHAYRLAGQIYAAEGDWPAASAAYAQAQAFAPKHPLIAWEAGLIYERQQETAADEGAHSRFQSAMEQAWQDAGIDAARLVGRGEEARAAQRYSEALRWYGRAARLDPQTSDPWYYSGLVYEALQQPEQALQAYQQASELNPDHRDIWYALGRLHVAGQRWDQALAAYERGVNADTGTIGASLIAYQIGYVRQYNLQPRDPEGAWWAYEQALALDNYAPQQWRKADTYYQRGVLLASQQRWAEAIEEYEQSMKLNPRHYGAHTGLASALWKLERWTEAIRTAQTAADYYPQYKQAYKLLGNFYSEIGKRSEARAMYTKVLELDPQDQGARKALDALSATPPSP